MSLLTTTDVDTMLGKGTTVQVTDIATGRSIVRQWFQQHRHIWPSVEMDVAGWYGCEPDDICLIETRAGDLITVRGEVVAKLEHV
jgi:hypothetical protein